MVKGETKPNRISFLLWSLAPLIGVAIAISDGVGLPALPIFMAGFNPLIIFIASFFTKNGYWKLTALDYFCGALSVVALIVWLSVHAPVVAITFAIASDLFAGIPTVIKSWKNPLSESPLLYILSTIGNIVGLLIINDWMFVAYAFSGYLIIMNSIILLGIYQRKFLKKA